MSNIKFSTKEEDLKAISTEQLLQEIKTIKVTTMTLIVLLAIEFCVAIYVSIDNPGMFSLVVVPFALSPILIINLKKGKDMKKEIKSRAMQHLKEVMVLALLTILFPLIRKKK
ncbi:MAG: hypothetical protein COC06_10985 [Bacteroidales bacterium]|nr:MAG: hypothetical protein COC06_10985 [Bacteroidales bacterium]